LFYQVNHSGMGYQVRVSLYSFMQSLETRRHNTV